MNLRTTFKASIAGVLALSFAASAAFAQPAGAGRGALRQACGADVQKFCPNMQPGPDIRACIRKNFASLSDPCKSALQQMRAQRQQQQSQGGGAAP